VPRVATPRWELNEERVKKRAAVDDDVNAKRLRILSLEETKKTLEVAKLGLEVISLKFDLMTRIEVNGRRPDLLTPEETAYLFPE